jgi:ABC-2 type transport system ATP-binding protein
MMNAIETENLTKYYGKSRGIIDVSLVVEPGQIFGFLGPNGAGKSTTIRLLLDLIRPTSGHARVLGMDVHRDRLAIDRRVSYIPGELSLYGELTGRQLLTYLGNLQGKVDVPYREELIERLELDPTKRIRSLSRGNRQKVGLVAAFMIRPDLLILDEPTAGLDPFIQLEFEDLCETAREEGRTAFISSHQLPEIEHLCDRGGDPGAQGQGPPPTGDQLRQARPGQAVREPARGGGRHPGRVHAALHRPGQCGCLDQGSRPLRGGERAEH